MHFGWGALLALGAGNYVGAKHQATLSLSIARAKKTRRGVAPGRRAAGDQAALSKRIGRAPLALRPALKPLHQSRAARGVMQFQLLAAMTSAGVASGMAGRDGAEAC